MRFPKRVYGGRLEAPSLFPKFLRASPAAANAPEQKTRRADIYDAVGAASGFDARVPQIFAVEEELEVRSDLSADAKIDDDDFAEAKGIFIVFKLPADPAEA